MKNKIITIGCEIPGYSGPMYSYLSNQSILDADIVFFEPDIDCYDFCSETYPKREGLYSKSASGKIRLANSHWHKELSIFLKAGKTVFVFFREYENFLVYLENSEHIVPCDNYRFFPIDLPTVVPRKGREILFLGDPVFSSFWKEFGEHLIYESYFDSALVKPLFITKTGDRPVGAKFQVGSGNLVLLPPLRYNQEKFTEYDSESSETYWTEAAVQFGNRFVEIFNKIDKALRGGSDHTPSPDWVNNDEFHLAIEKNLKNEIKTRAEKIEELVMEKESLIERLAQESKIKDLLFEKGDDLEQAVIRALRILGYNAEKYNDGELELDQVIHSPEGDRFIGEDEGKDNAAINIDKLRQLVMNIHEDSQKEGVDCSAIGILFGNGYRLMQPLERSEQFTDKCIKAAKSCNCILIRTSDLFSVVKYIKRSNNSVFAKKCRNAIKNSVGKIVNFPDIPS